MSITRRPAKERREALKKRTEESVQKRDDGMGGRFQVISLEGFDNVPWFKPVKGKNLIDIIPFIISTENHPQGIEPGFEDYKLDIWVHRNIGPTEATILCLKETFGKRCPICEARQEMRKNPDIDDEDAKALDPKRRTIFNVIDLQEEEKGIQLWEVSYFLFDKELLEEVSVAEDGLITFADLGDGRSIEFRGAPKKLGGQTFLEFKSFRFHEREAYNEEILDDAYPLDSMLIIPTYEHTQQLLMGVDDKEEGVGEEEKSKQEEKPSKPTRGRKPKHKKTQEEPKTGKCSFGTFGADCNKLDECADCQEELFEACAAEEDRLLAEKQEDKKTGGDRKSYKRGK